MLVLVLVSGATTAVIQHRASPYLGRLTTPKCGTRVGHDGLPWAADNGCFKGLDEPAFVRMLERIPRGAIFVVAPDVLCDHAATVEQWKRWAPMIRELGQRVAFVLQDGCDSIPDDTDAVFVGGSTEFKLSPGAAALVRSAKRRGLWAHMGRVNTRRRMLYAGSLGCDSVDGTSASMFPDTNLPKLLSWAEQATRQLTTNQERHDDKNRPTDD